MLIGALMLGATALGALGVTVCTGAKEKKTIETQKPTVNHNHYTIGNIDKGVHIDQSIKGNNNNIKQDDNKELIESIRALLSQQNSDNQSLLNDIMANDQELARLIRK